MWDVPPESSPTGRLEQKQSACCPAPFSRSVPPVIVQNRLCTGVSQTHFAKTPHRGNMQIIALHILVPNGWPHVEPCSLCWLLKLHGSFYPFLAAWAGETLFTLLVALRHRFVHMAQRGPDRPRHSFLSAQWGVGGGGGQG